MSEELTDKIKLNGDGVPHERFSHPLQHEGESGLINQVRAIPENHPWREPYILTDYLVTNLPLDLSVLPDAARQSIETFIRRGETKDPYTQQIINLNEIGPDIVVLFKRDAAGNLFVSNITSKVVNDLLLKPQDS